MPKKPTPPQPTHYRIKLGRAVRHPDHPEVQLSPKGALIVSAAIKDALGDAVIEAVPAGPDEI